MRQPRGGPAVVVDGTPICTLSLKKQTMNNQSKPSLLTLLSLLICVNAFGQTPVEGLRYPDTRKVDQIDTYFQKVVEDPYRWLEDDRSEETADWVTRQNETTFSYLKAIPFRNDVRKRLEKLWNYEKYSAPFKEGKFTYFFKNNGLQNQSVLYRELSGSNNAPEVFLDPNQFSKDGTSSLAGIQFSEDGSLCAYQISEGGSDWRKVVVMDAVSRKLLGDTLYDVKFSSLSWKGQEGFFYCSYDKPKDGSALSGKTQYHKLFYHRMGKPQNTDELVFGGEKQPYRYLGGVVSEDNRWLFISAAQATYGNELYIRDLSVKNAPIRPMITGLDFESDVVHVEGEQIYILTNFKAPNRRLMVVSAKDPSLKSMARTNSGNRISLVGNGCRRIPYGYLSQGRRIAGHSVRFAGPKDSRSSASRFGDGFWFWC